MARLSARQVPDVLVSGNDKPWKAAQLPGLLEAGTPSSTPCFPMRGGACFGCTAAQGDLGQSFLPLQEWRWLRCRAAPGGLCVRRVLPVQHSHQLSAEIAPPCTALAPAHAPSASLDF